MATTQKATAVTELPALQSKLGTGQAVMEGSGQCFKHIVVRLKGAQDIAVVRESPEMWSAIQGDRMLKLGRGDRVSLIAPDGLVIADQMAVTKALSGSVWLSKPLRMIQLEEVALFSDGKLEVVPAGVGFALQHVRDGGTESRVYASAEAAKAEILRRQPQQVA
jgi:hypothetical protein